MSVNYSHLFGIYRSRFAAPRRFYATAGRQAIPSSKSRIARECFPDRWNRLGTDQYVSHTDPSLGWSLDVDYDDYDPSGNDADNYPDDLGCYGFLQYDSHNGVWWVQSHIQGTVGSVWIDCDWETPVYWVSRIDKHWNAIRGDWELIDAGVKYHGDDLIAMIDKCLEMI